MFLLCRRARLRSVLRLWIFQTNMLNMLKQTGRSQGPLLHPPRMWDERDASQWLGFREIDGLNVYGFGFVDGRGQAWWDQSCKYHSQLALKLLSCNIESSISNMNLINSAQTHILVKGCNTVTIDNVIIQAPGNSPNTDGIHLQSSHYVVITNSRIGSELCWKMD